MLAARSGPRITIVTALPALARNNAACPAELPPPAYYRGRTRARSGLQLGRRVVHTTGLEPLQADGVEPSVARSGRDDDRPTWNLRPIGEAKNEVARSDTTVQGLLNDAPNFWA
jgi:hypothetical protein